MKLSLRYDCNQPDVMNFWKLASLLYMYPVIPVGMKG